MILKKIPEIMSDIGFIGKDKKNIAQNFMFRGIDQVMNTMKPLLAKHGVFIVPEVVDVRREERPTKSGGMSLYTLLTVKHHFVAEDGSEIVSTTVGEGMDSGDKATNKAMAVAFKYACFQVFCIPTEEMAKDDPDNYSDFIEASMMPTEVQKQIETCPDVKTLQDIWNTNTNLQKDKIFVNLVTKRKHELAK